MNAVGDADDFENALFHFLTAVNVMAADAEHQLRATGYLHAAWEIQHDVIEGASLLDHPISYLDRDQWRAIQDLVSAARQLPKEALDGNSSLNHVAWVRLRILAKELLAILAPAIARNTEYFGRG